MVASALRSARFALGTVTGKQRVIGVVLLLALLIPFFALNRLPKLDTVRADLALALAPTAECFQGFCIEREPESTFLQRWWRFSLTYLQLVTAGMVFAFLAGGIAETFLMPAPTTGAGPPRPLLGGRWGRILKGLGMGPVVNLCSACIVPVSSAMHRRGLGIEGSLALVHGSATLNVPSLLMIAVVFSPLLGASRLALGLTAAFLLGPLVLWVARTAASTPAAWASAAEDVACRLPAWGDGGVPGEPRRKGSEEQTSATGRPETEAAGAPSGSRSPWWNPASHRERRGARLAGRDETSISGMGERAATQPAGRMHRRANGAGVSPPAAARPDAWAAAPKDAACELPAWGPHGAPGGPERQEAGQHTFASGRLEIVAGGIASGCAQTVTGGAAGGPTRAAPGAFRKPADSWAAVAVAGVRQWARATGRLVVQMAPLMVVAGFASGAAIQLLQPETVDAYLGDSLSGVLAAATLGVLINVPLLFEIPLVALLLVLGAGAAPSAALLFAAAAGGPITFWGLARTVGRRGIAAYAAGTWTIAVLGGLLVLAVSTQFPALAPLRSALVPAAPPAVKQTPAGPTHARPADAVPLAFRDVSVAAGVSGDIYHSLATHSLGVNWIDVNRDGWPDLFAVRGDSGLAPRLFLNRGDGSFEPRHDLLPELPGMEMSGSVFADYDNDGDDDIYVYTDHPEWSLQGYNAPDGPPNLLLKNLLSEHGGRLPAAGPLFAEVAAAAGVDDLAPAPFGELPAYRTKAASWLDYDRDGCVDLYVGHIVINNEADPANRDRLFHNECDGTFTDATDHALPAAADYRAALVVYGAHLDDDLWPDLYVVNVAGNGANRALHTDQVYRNRGGRFVQVFDDWPWIGDDAQAGMGIAAADVDLNGTWDLYITDLLDATTLERPPGGNVLYLGDASGAWADNKAAGAGVAGTDSWGINFLDADHDGWEDLYVATMVHLNDELLYANNRNGTFTNVAGQAGYDGYDTGASRGSAVADYDGDGDLDIAVVNQHEPHCAEGSPPSCSLQLLRNDTTAAGNWLKLRLTGTASNRSAIGALVRVQAGPLRLMRQVTGGSSGHSQNSLVVHFGLGRVEVVDRVEILWPSGARTNWSAQPPDTLIDVVEGRACTDGQRAECVEAPPAPTTAALAGAELASAPDTAGETGAGAP
ncbi:MAG: FG-GAP-like repeat-containing protein [Spirochaetaceae bacterium]|nr:FG-GAP-like repeat-containing protein [Spirochaetaceae bacterium]